GAWLVDDTGYPKQGKHSVGVARQYCGMLGKTMNCQAAVTTSIANDWASLPVAHRLYLPEKWAGDTERRKRAGVPVEVVFQTKWVIALDQITGMVAAGVPRGTVLADAGYGDVADFRKGVTELGLPYVVGVREGTAVWRPGEQPLPPARQGTRGPHPKRVRRDEGHQPVTVLALAKDLPADAWQDVTWREGTQGDMTSRFARVRVRPAHRDYYRIEPRDEEWLLIEWPSGEDKPTRYWLSTQPEEMDFRALVRLAKLRWRIERDYEEMKDELGFDHFEGRGWRGFHHHATLCIAAYAFLMAERARLSPPGAPRKPPVETPPIPAGFRPRGAAHQN
ncbi:MAG: IS701 family transposase, partial [Deltaproteobacteria bacterium]|nr:IS701 family transposase [Deltaproteobacteria bacterium]